jgi:hypothetical protein
MGLMNPSGGGGVNAELIFSNCELCRRRSRGPTLAAEALRRGTPPVHPRIAASTRDLREVTLLPQYLVGIRRLCLHDRSKNNDMNVAWF